MFEPGWLQPKEGQYSYGMLQLAKNSSICGMLREGFIGGQSDEEDIFSTVRSKMRCLQRHRIGRGKTAYQARTQNISSAMHKMRRQRSNNGAECMIAPGSTKRCICTDIAAIIDLNQEPPNAVAFG
jgi:hypothetical protein